ncbi:6-phosphogluconate dehydrogenase [Mrakia frigida]|uniref:NAD(P)-dependent oxidoreductase n=1 Tax=Mrakia frigida TaxID=29902 RepID=UPI003FCC1C77
MSSLHMSPSHSMPGTPLIDTPASEPSNPFSRPSSPTVQPHERVGFVGLGNMGSKMAFNMAASLQSKGRSPLIVWNRSQGRIDDFLKLCSEGKDGNAVPVVVAKSAREVAERCDVVITSIGSDHALEEIFVDLFAGQQSKKALPDSAYAGGRGKPSLFIDTSTIYPHTAGRLERIAAKVPHRHFLSCPAFGRPEVALDAQLIFAISGDLRAKKHASHLLVPALGRKVYDLGANVEKAAAFKLVGNSLIIGVIELLAETMTLAEQSGVGQDKLYELIKDVYPAPSFLTYGKKMLKNDYNGQDGFTLAGGIKDAAHIRKLAEEHGVPMPLIDIAHQHLISARANGGAKLDWSSLVGGVRISAGLPPFSGQKNRLQRLE